MAHVTRLVLLAFALAHVAACATNPVTGRREFVLVGEAQEIAMGRQYAPQITDSMGGLLDDEALQAYVESVGLPMARASERPSLPWQFGVVDDPAVNAFALPGGFIFVTRGILAHMSSEAEFASVLGHEIGHVTARHSVNQITKQQSAQLLLGIGAVALGDDFAPLVSGAGMLVQLGFLKYGRDQESQSDDLGLRYMSSAGYQPTEMVSMFRTLGRTSETSGGGAVPQWLASHPSPANREQRISQAIGRMGGAADGVVERESFLARIDGMKYGPDPRDGFFDGPVFHHPALGFRMRVPAGWKTSNQPGAVNAMSPQKDAMLQLTLVKEATAEAAARRFFSAPGFRSSGVEAKRVNGLDAWVGNFALTTQQGALAGRALHVEHRGRVHRIVGFTTQQGFAGFEAALRSTLASFAEERDPAILALEPWRLEIVRPSRSLTIEEFARVYPGPVPAEELARLNELDPGERYRAGVPVKRVRGSSFPGSR
jgi:predicted Zn-dependent protease